MARRGATPSARAWRHGGGSCSDFALCILRLESQDTGISRNSARLRTGAACASQKSRFQNGWPRSPVRAASFVSIFTIAAFLGPNLDCSRDQGWVKRSLLRERPSWKRRKCWSLADPREPGFGRGMSPKSSAPAVPPLSRAHKSTAKYGSIEAAAHYFLAGTG